MKIYEGWEYDIVNKEFELFPLKYATLVDVGAKGNYGVVPRLLKRNWNGVLYEPHPESYKELIKLYENNILVKVLNNAVSNETGRMIFLLHPSPELSSLAPNVTWFKEDTKVTKIEVEVVKLHESLQEHNISIPKDFDFLKVDAEGFDYRILECMFKESFYRPRIIMHEIQHPGPKEFEKLLNLQGYELINKEPEHNMIYRKKE